MCVTIEMREALDSDQSVGLADPGRWVCLDEADSEFAAIVDVLDHWNEDDSGAQSFRLIGTDGKVLATLDRPCLADPELARVITYGPGGLYVCRVTYHRCTYVVSTLGRYLRTRITECGPPCPIGWDHV